VEGINMSAETTGHRADISTNKDGGNKVADDLNGLLAWTRINSPLGASVAIATAYFNPGGFNLLAAELEQVRFARLLLGAEPNEGADHPRVRALADRRLRRGPDPAVARALSGHARSLEEDRDLCGFTREADAQARRLVAWLRANPNTVKVRRYEAGFLHGKAFIVDQGNLGLVVGSSNFTYAGLAKNNELNVGRYDPTPVGLVIDWFNQQWDTSVPYDLAALYEARWAPHQPWDVFLRMLFEMYGADMDADQGVKSRLGLTGFQADGVWRAKRILDRRKGVLIADEVGLGKTFMAGELIHEAVYDRRQKVLIVAPATLRDATWLPFLLQYNLPAKVLSFEQLVADIEDAGARTAALQDLDQYAMVVVDEAHALRNERTRRADAMRQVLAGPVPKSLVELTATPINNSLDDLYNLIALFSPNDAAFGDVGIPSLRRYFNKAMAMNPDDLSPEHLFDVLDEVAVRRTRRFVKNHYAGDTVTIDGVEQVITFPTCRVVRVDYNLNDVLPGVFNDLAIALGADIDPDVNGPLASAVILADPGAVLTMARYVPSRFQLDGDTEAYEAQNAGLLRSGLLKRFESSSHAFEQTVTTMIASQERFLDALDAGLVLTGDALREWSAAPEEVDEFLASTDDIEHAAYASNYNCDDLRAAVLADRDLLAAFQTRVRTVHPGNDPKIEALVDELASIAADAAVEGIGDEIRDKRKVLIFTYFADTASYLQDALHAAISTDPRLAVYRGRMAMVFGPDKSNRTDVIRGFAPRTAGKPGDDDLYDLVITTDVLAEGVNLQQARHICNYDLPWNPQRLVQRHGRIDRIGSRHSEVFMRCFFPDADLDRILGLEAVLQRKLKQASVIGTGLVLPGVDPVDRVISDTRERIAQLRREDAALFDDDTGASLSGEDYRRRLSTAFRTDTTKARVLGLPWGSGTGFTRPGALPGFVFCARIGDHPKPWFRYVPMKTDTDGDGLTFHADATGAPIVISDTLACLDQADPQIDDTPAVLDQTMYTAAFDAWSLAQKDVQTAWTFQTDPANLAPQIPRVMRDATALVRQHGGFLGEVQDRLAARLNAPYPVRIQREIRAVMTTLGTNDRDKVTELAEVADRQGLTPPAQPPLLPPIEISDIYLVCWTAISPQPAAAVESSGTSPDTG
jgi:Helicase conserved C-terminal domain/PLD-like domain/SNF2-related domain